MIYWIDTHAHIYSEEFKADLVDVLARATDKGVGKIYMPNIDHTSIDAMLEVEQKNKEKCIPMMGLHPCYVNKNFEKELYEVESWLARRKFAAIGEIGTDLYCLLDSFSFYQQYFINLVMHRLANIIKSTMDIFELASICISLCFMQTFQMFGNCQD